MIYYKFYLVSSSYIDIDYLYVIPDFFPPGNSVERLALLGEEAAEARPLLEDVVAPEPNKGPEEAKGAAEGANLLGLEGTNLLGLAPNFGSGPKPNPIVIV